MSIFIVPALSSRVFYYVKIIPFRLIIVNTVPTWASVNISRHFRTCLVLPTVMVIFILTCYVLFIALLVHTTVMCLTLFQIIYMRHIPCSCMLSPQCLSIHWGVHPLSLFYLFPYLLAIVPRYSTLGTTTEYISVYPFTEVTWLFYSSSLPVPAFLQHRLTRLPLLCMHGNSCHCLHQENPMFPYSAY